MLVVQGTDRHLVYDQESDNAIKSRSMNDVHMGKVRGGGEYSRPRRPNQDTVTYLRSLPMDVKVFAEEVREIKEKGITEPPALFCASLAAISEIRDEVASLATEEESAATIETLARIATPYSEIAARVLLQGISGYALFLSTHRYGSHVLQTLLESSSEIHHLNDFEVPDDIITNTEELPGISELIMGILQELVPAAPDLSIHICGSHVLRTMVCIMGGVKIVGAVDSGRGAQRGKKKKKKGPVTKDSRPVLRMTFVDSRLDWRGEKVKTGLSQLVSAISGDEVAEPGNLQQLGLHPSASPLLGVLLQCLVYRDARSTWETRLQQIETDIQTRKMDHHLLLVRPEPSIKQGGEAFALMCRILCLTVERVEQEWAADVIYGLAGEPHGSHLLEKVLHVSDESTLDLILTSGGFYKNSSLKEYIEHDVSNFVVQAVITSARSEKQAEKLSEALLPFVSSGYVLKASHRRRGIMWRLAELASKYPAIQRPTLKAMREGFVKLGAVESMSNGLVACVPELLTLVVPPENTGGRLALDVAGTRTLFYLLRFEAKYCEEALLGISRLTAEELFLLAKDGLGSRCIWDGVLEGPTRESHFSTALKRVLKTLSGKWVTLASDRVGYHTVQKLFRRLVDMSDRESLVQELSESIHRLTGNNMGRLVLESCSVREYNDMGYAEWSKVVRKTAEKEGWLRDLDTLSAEIKPKKHRERKRKRDRSSNIEKDAKIVKE